MWIRDSYKDGKHSLEWTFEPNGRLELRKDLKFEKKDPTGKDLYLSAFIVWIYNEQPQDAAIAVSYTHLDVYKRQCFCLLG